MKQHKNKNLKLKKNKKSFYLPLILIILSFIFMLSSGTIFIYKKIDNNKKHEIDKYISCFLQSKINEKEDNPLIKELNYIINSEDTINEKLVLSKDISEVKQLSLTIEKVNNRINKLNEIKLDTKNIDESINKYSKHIKKYTLEKLKTNKNYIDISSYNKRKDEEILELNKVLILFNYLKENQSNYTISNNKIVGKSDTFVSVLTSLSKDNNYNIEIIKEVKNIIHKVPILMYHGVEDITWGIEGLFVKVGEFEKQIKYLKENGYTSFFMNEIDNFTTVKKPIVITFDDGYVDVYKNAFPTLKKYGIKGTLFTIANARGGVYVNDEQIKEMSDSGVIEIGSHSLNHNPLGKQNKESIEKELKTSKDILEKLINKKVESLAYPYGSVNDTVVETAKKYYKTALIASGGKETFNKDTNRYKLKRIEIHRATSIEGYKNIIK
ncbi:MAG: polysaccharide deacetylase family protein [Bacilli bacterium]